VSDGTKISHGGDVYYMSPGKDYGRFLSVGVQRALDAGVEAVHLEEPEFWSWGGYGDGFKREWRDYYHEDWQDPHLSADARWRASKLMYFLYRRALQQVFDHIREYNEKTGKHVRCYVPTHSLLNYATWGIVSPESSLARLNGCDGYIAQVWTGTSRTPNFYQGVKKERTFETAFLEYGAMQNLVRSTGRRVWYLADPIEDNANHDWGDYRHNWQSTLTASLLQPEVWRYEVVPWPERVWNGTYRSESDPSKKVPIPESYSTELQTVYGALRDMDQRRVEWECGTRGIGVIVSDSLMFQRGDPPGSDPDLSHFYGLALPFVKLGMPVGPVQLENVTLPHYLDQERVLLMTYRGMKPLSEDVHRPIADWVKAGGTLIFVDDDQDPFDKVREWWNSGSYSYQTPRQDLFKELGIDESEGVHEVGRGRVLFLKRDPSEIAHDAEGAKWLTEKVRDVTKGRLRWQTKAQLVLRRGPYIVASGMDETNAPHDILKGHFVDLFDSKLQLLEEAEIAPGSRHLFLDLDRIPKTQRLLALAGSASGEKSTADSWSANVSGIERSRGIALIKCPSLPNTVELGGKATNAYRYDPDHRLLWIEFENHAQASRLTVRF
jgi:hypothetical protein